MRKRQCTYPGSDLPAWIVVCILFAVPQELAARQQYRVTSRENFRRDSSVSAPVLASVNAGTTLQGAGSARRWVPVTLEGWIWGPSATSTSRDGFHLVVSAGGGENLRVEPNGTVLARLAEGCLLQELERRGDWTHVRRTGWMWGQSLSEIVGVAGLNPSGAAAVVEDTVLPDLTWGVTADRVALRQVPDGDTVGTLASETAVRIMARSGEWVRVQAEGWMREDELGSGLPGVIVGVSGAEVRSRPEEFEGKLIQWRVQFIAVQRADEVRYDIPAGQRYLLVRGPWPETAFAYLTVTEEQLERVERLEPLSDLVIIGRVRVGRSRYLGNPVLQLIDFAERRQ